MIILKNIKQLMTLESAAKKDGRNLVGDDLSLLEDASVVIENNLIKWVGKFSTLPNEYKGAKRIDCSELVVTPEIVDSHTHLVFGGNRAFEYTMRLNGADYEDIANAGGGILSTMENTLKESNEILFNDACERIDRIYSYGVGAIEIKSGYALDYDKEKEISKLIHKLKEKYRGKVKIFNTFLAAHAVPKTFNSSSDYLDNVVIPLLKELADEDIIDAADIFHEQGYFSEEDTRKLFDLCKVLGIQTKIHADEFHDNGGASLAAEYGSLSADHLLATSEKGIKALSDSQTVATLLPGTAFFLGKKLADAKKFLDLGCKLALASDYNPGSCHCDNLLLIASIAGKNLSLNAAQLWASITLNAASALGYNNQGSIEIGKEARFSFFKCNSFDEIVYNWGRNFAIEAEKVFSQEAK